VPGRDSAALPLCVATADGSLHVAWLDYRPFTWGGPRWVVVYRRVQGWQAAGVPGQLVLGGEQVISSPAANATGLALATNGENLVVFAWVEVDGSLERVRARRLKLVGQGTQFAQAVTLNGALLGASNPWVGAPEVACVRGATGGEYAYVAWVQYDGPAGSGGGLAEGRDQVYFARSQDGGASWAGPASVADCVNLDRESHHESPRLAASPLGGVHVAWLDTRQSLPGGAQALDLFVRSSPNFGVGFGAEEQLSRDCLALPCTPPSFAAIRPSIAAGPDGSVGVAWVDASCVNVGRTRLRARRSLDAGATWSCEVPVGRANGLMLHVDTDLAAGPGGELWAAWSRVDLDQAPARPSVFAARLEPLAGAWQPERRVSLGGSPLGLKGSVPPLARARIAADPLAPSRALVAWMHTEAGFEEDFDVVAAWTSDGGATWSAPGALVTEPGPGNRKTRAAFPSVALRGGRAAVVWDDRRHWTDPLQAGLPLPPQAPLGAPSVYLNWVDVSAGAVP